ncbi:MAG: photosystem I assembly protein Ycf4, partial [Synechococcus sp. BS307-5m-G38]|nr:photosystem I assembly protein Ycf4 [Synechococcus sp. BS307-5m-G38]
RFDKAAGVVTVTRRGFRKPVLVEIPLKDVKAVKVEVRDGFNARRRVALRIKGRRDMPLTRVGEPLPLAQLEQDGAELARFLGVNLEGL